MNAEQRRAEIRKFLENVDWNSYDYKKAPGADLSFPDFTEAQLATNLPWVPKHYNTTSGWNCVHVPDLNQMADGEERRLWATYGVPVEWPTKRDDEDALDDLLCELDSAREEGGEEWAEAMDEHGLLNDEHYLFVRGYSLGFPEGMTDYEKAKRAIVEIESAIAEGDADDLFSEYGFRDQLHFEYFHKRVQKAKAKAWQQHDAILAETSKALDERFAKNKEALSDELAPFKGMSLETWAQANARLAQGESVDAVLGALRMERPQWDEINAEWNARMSRDSTATIATVYGQAFTGAGQGQFGAAAKNVASSMESGFGQKVKDASTLSFEDWVKIQAHMTVATTQGVDPQAVLAQYSLNAADWGQVGGYWGMKLASEPMEYMDKYSSLTAKYMEKFAAGKAGSDIEF